VHKKLCKSTLATTKLLIVRKIVGTKYYESFVYPHDFIKVFLPSLTAPLVALFLPILCVFISISVWQCRLQPVKV